MAQAAADTPAAYQYLIYYAKHYGQSAQVRSTLSGDLGLADVLTRAFGVPAVVADALQPIEGIEEAYIYGSWAARHEGQGGQRPVGDIDVLILGDPGRDQLYDALAVAEKRLGRPIQATIRDPGWLRSGKGSFHETITSRPMLKLAL